MPRGTGRQLADIWYESSFRGGHSERHLELDEWPSSQMNDDRRASNLLKLLRYLLTMNTRKANKEGNE